MFKVGVLIRSRFLPYKNCSTMDALHEVCENDRLSYFYFSKALTQPSSSHLSTDLIESGHSNICRLVVFSIFFGCRFHLLLHSKSASYCCCLCLMSRQLPFWVISRCINVVFETGSLCSRSLPWTFDLLAYTSGVLGLQACFIILSRVFFFFLFVCFHSCTIPKTSQS